MQVAQKVNVFSFDLMIPPWKRHPCRVGHRLRECEVTSSSSVSSLRVGSLAQAAQNSQRTHPKKGAISELTKTPPMGWAQYPPPTCPFLFLPTNFKQSDMTLPISTSFKMYDQRKVLLTEAWWKTEMLMKSHAAILFGRKTCACVYFVATVTKCNSESLWQVFEAFGSCPVWQKQLTLN